MLHAAIKNLLGHKLRMFLTGFSIILGVSFVAGTYIFTDSISSTLNNLFSDVYSGIDLSVRPKQAEFGEVTQKISQELVDKVKATEGVSAIAPEVAGYAQFVGTDGKPIGGQGPPTLGFEWTTEPGLRALDIQDGDGRAPEKAGEVVMDKATASAHGFKVGDKVKVLLQGPAEEFTLVGIASFGDANGLAGATLAAFEIHEAQRIFDYPDSYSGIDIKADNNTSTEELKARIDALLPAELESVTGEQQSNEQFDEINSNLGFVNTALLAFAGVAIFVGSYIIQNTFRIIVAQRSKELALLRAIGATKAQVVRLVLYEATVIAFLASSLGIVLGMVVSKGVRALMNSVGFTLPNGPMSIQARTIVISYCVGVGVTLIAALLPALRASRVSPVEAMRDNEAATSSRKSLFSRGLIGLFIILAGAGSLIYGLNGTVAKPLYPVGFGVVAMFIGVSVIAPLLSGPLASVVGWPLTRLRGMSAVLARDNAKRTPRRTASTAAALMIGVSLVTLLSVLATSFKSQITTILNDSFPADVTISSLNIGENGPGSASFSNEVYKTLENVPELTDVTALRYQFEGVKIQDAVQLIVGIDTPSFTKLVKLGETEGAYDKLIGNSVVLNKDFADKNGWSIGSKIDMTFAKTGTKTFDVVGTFSEAYDSDILISTATYFENFDSKDITLVVANAANDYTDTDAKNAAQKALSGYAQLSIQDKGDIFKTAEEQINQILSLFWGLLGFAIIIAVLGITNTLMLSISERTKEIGMLRAIGMTRTQVRRMIRYESVIIALFGAVLGVSMGIFFGWAVLRALKSEGFTAFVLPYGQLVLYFVLAVLAGIIAAAWPARKAARMDILKAIYHD